MLYGQHIGYLHPHFMADHDGVSARFPQVDASYTRTNVLELNKVAS